MLPASRNIFFANLRPIRSWREKFTIMCEQVARHSKLFQEGKSERGHFFSNETKDLLKHPMEQQGFIRGCMKFHT